MKWIEHWLFNLNRFITWLCIHVQMGDFSHINGLNIMTLAIICYDSIGKITLHYAM